jgi:hypothetical protein
MRSEDNVSISGVSLANDGIVVELSDGTAAKFKQEFLLENLDRAAAVVHQDEVSD